MDSPFTPASPTVGGYPLFITGLGMVSSLGRSVQACAAARAGLTRWTELDAEVSDEDTLELEPLRGHAVRGLTEGFEGTGRLVRLGNAALEDLFLEADLARAAPTRTAVLLCLPGDFYEESHLELRELAPLPEGALKQRLRTRERAEQEGRRQSLERRLIPQLLALQQPALRPHVSECFFGGGAVLATALQRAMELMGSRTVERCIVGAIDTYVHGRPLEVVRGLGLVRSPNVATGFFPGEAAAFLLLERPDAARLRGARVQAVLRASATAQEPFHRFSGVTPAGAALFEAIAACARQAAPGLRDVARALVSLNGDDFRAMDFGNTLVRLGNAGLSTAFGHVFPAEHFGELGAATGPVAVCLGVRALARGYAGGRCILGALLSDDMSRGAFLLEAPEG